MPEINSASQDFLLTDKNNSAFKCIGVTLCLEYPILNLARLNYLIILSIWTKLFSEIYLRRNNFYFRDEK